MSVGSDDHGRLLNLLEIIRLDNIYSIDSTQRSKTLLPGHARTLAFDLGRHGSGDLLKVLRIFERLGGKPTEDNVGCHGTPPCTRTSSHCLLPDFEFADARIHSGRGSGGEFLSDLADVRADPLEIVDNGHVHGRGLRHAYAFYQSLLMKQAVLVGHFLVSLPFL